MQELLLPKQAAAVYVASGLFASHKWRLEFTEACNCPHGSARVHTIASKKYLQLNDMVACCIASSILHNIGACEACVMPCVYI